MATKTPPAQDAKKHKMLRIIRWGLTVAYSVPVYCASKNVTLSTQQVFDESRHMADAAMSTMPEEILDEE